MTKIMIEVDLDDETSMVSATETIAQLMAAVGGSGGEPSADEKKAASKAAKAKAKAIKEAEAEAEAAAAAEAKEEDSSDDGDSDGPTRDDVREALKGLAALDDKKTAIAILKDHDASSIAELDEDQFADVIAAVAAKTEEVEAGGDELD
ncbi:MAG: hypothetical protein V3S55_15595 [Nitrospiraceae bacterium]